MSRLDELKQKYLTVFRAIERYQIRLDEVRVEGEKLVIRAEAPDEFARERVLEQIALVDSNPRDLAARISTAPATAITDRPAQPNGSHVYVVRAGDTLPKISEEFYGDANEYRTIFEANRERLPDPDKLIPGLELVIPAKAA